MDWAPTDSFQTSLPCDKPPEAHDMASEHYYQALENQLIQHHSWGYADHVLSIPSQNGTVFSETPLQFGNYAEGYLPANLEASANHMLLSNANFESDIGTMGLSDLNVNTSDHVTDMISPRHHDHLYAWGSSEMISQEDGVYHAACMMLYNHSNINVGSHDSGELITIHEKSSASNAMILFPGTSVSFAGPSDTRQMSYVEPTAICEDQAILNTVTPLPISQPPATRKTIRSAKKVSHSDTKWDELRKDHLNRLYIKENHTLDEVVFELAAIHNIEIGKSTIERRLKDWPEFSKNNVSQQHQQEGVSTRRRTASALTSLRPNSTSPFAQFPFVSLNTTRRQAEVERIRELSPATYLHQERMFHALDQLVKGLLASGQKSWTVDPVRPISFIAPNSGGRTEHASTTPRSPPSQDWEPLVEKCRGMATLAETSQFSELLSVFGNVLASTKQMVQICAPDFLVYFWKICIALFQVRIGGRRDYLCLRLFLHSLGAYLARSPSVGAHHAVTVFAASLIGVVESEPLDLKVTLGLAYWKAIHVLASLLGGDHAIVLNMTTHCVRHWPGRFTPQKHVLESAYQELLSRKSSAPWALSEKDVSLQLDYLRTVSAKKNYAPDVIQRADELRRITRDISLSKATTGRLQATVTTRAFDFTTELLTAHHLEAASHARDADSVEASQAVAFGLLNTAIEIFREGSLECQIRAVAFSKRLEVHLRASGRKKQGLDEKDRGRDVRLAIKRAVMEPSWEPSFTPTVRRSSRPRASTKAAWAAQKRRTRVESRDHLVCMLQAESRTRIST
ncbi:hypothetical protein CTAM01_15299 [Colletotrichum tamarilloi]|uniref:Clr5 domain-containing protein n=1 Tax=Colletotrichum tamarilloi TaxID=1209934 RepID=A0ABQ9QLU1_9PEZI|nr:uncharacterized protein CTAM01_15299 [Colletotrichum tamarilloi]KAK1476948.1 hypothetical protein CTAM01_15299 [Colletotrichum tamarilloi]